MGGGCLGGCSLIDRPSFGSPMELLQNSPPEYSEFSSHLGIRANWIAGAKKSRSKVAPLRNFTRK